MEWWNQLVRGIGTSNAPFGFAPVDSPSQGQVDPAYNAGMQMLGNVGMGMLASGEKNPMTALGKSYLVASQNAQQQNKDQYVAAKMLEEADAKKQERAREQEKQKWLEDQISQLPPQQQGIARMMPEKFFGAQIEQMFPKPGAANTPQIGLTPIPLVNKTTGEYGVGQLSDRGLVINGQPVSGSDWQPYDPYSLNQQKAAGSTAGKGRGQAEVDYESYKSKMPGLEKVIAELDTLAEDATYTLAGQAYNAGRTQLGFSPTDGAVARTKYQATVANQVLPLLRDTFGAQFTQVEGERLLSTLGDPDKTPREKQAVLKAFIEQKRRDVEALGVQAGKIQAAPTAGGSPDSGAEEWTIGPDGKPQRVR